MSAREDDGVRANLIRDTLLAPALQKIEEVGGTLTGRLESIEERLTEQTDQLAALTEESGIEPAIVRSEYPYDFSVEEVPAQTTKSDPVEVEVEVSEDVRLKESTFTSTAAADHHVAVQFGMKSGERYIPRNDPSESRYLSLDDTPRSATLNVDIEAGTVLVARYINTDTEPHFGSGDVVMQEQL